MKHALGALALFLVMMALAVSAREGMFSRDGVVFMTLAQRVLEGDLASVLLHPQQPLVPFLIALLQKTGLEPVTAGRLVSMAGLGTVLASLTILVCRRSGTVAGFWTFVFMLASPFVLEDGSDILSDAPYWGFTVLGILLLTVASDTRRLVLGIPAGVFLAASALTRPEGYVVAGVVILGVMFHFRRGASQCALILVMASGAFFLTVSPYIHALHKVTGDWRLSMKVDFAKMAGLGRVFPTSTPARDVMRVGSLSVENSRDEFLESPTPGMQARYALNQTLFKFFDTLGIIQGLVLLAGAVTLRRRLLEHPEILALAGVTAFLGAVQWIQDHYLSHRHIMLAALSLGALCGPLWVEFTLKLKTRFPRGAGALSALIISVALGVAVERQGKCLRGEEARRASNKVHLSQIGLALRERNERHLVGSDCRVSWFARKTHIEWPLQEDPFAYIHDEVPGTVGRDFVLVLPDDPPHERYSKHDLAAKLRADGWREFLSMGGETAYVRD